MRYHHEIVSEEKSPLIDFSCFKSFTLRVLSISNILAATGLTCPVLFLASMAEVDGLKSDVVYLYSYLGSSWIVGCLVFGCLITRKGSIYLNHKNQYMINHN